MSRTRDGRLYYTKEELERAKQNSSALQYAMGRYELVRVGNRYTMKEHDSMAFLPDGMWFWNSRGVYGGAIDFIRHYEGKSFTEAVLTLAGTLSRDVGAPVLDRRPPAPPRQEESFREQPFILPERAESFRAAFSYLTKTRGISCELVRQLMKEHRLLQVRWFSGLKICGYAQTDQGLTALYVPKPELEERLRPFLQERQIVSLDAHKPLEAPQSTPCLTGQEAARLAEQGYCRQCQAVAMVGCDPEGSPRYCSLRSMNSTGKGFKMDVSGSRKQYPFVIPGKEGTAQAVVVESPIEAMSYRDICTMTGSPLSACHIVALGGVSAAGLDGFLQNHPEITGLQFALNRDDDGKHKMQAGERATGRLAEQYRGRFEVSVHKPALNDWNDVLCRMRAAWPAPARAKMQEPPAPKIE